MGASLGNGAGETRPDWPGCGGGYPPQSALDGEWREY